MSSSTASETATEFGYKLDTLHRKQTTEASATLLCLLKCNNYVQTTSANGCRAVAKTNKNKNQATVEACNCREQEASFQELFKRETNGMLHEKYQIVRFQREYILTTQIV